MCPCFWELRARRFCGIVRTCFNLHTWVDRPSSSPLAHLAWYILEQVSSGSPLGLPVLSSVPAGRMLGALQLLEQQMAGRMEAWGSASVVRQTDSLRFKSLLYWVPYIKPLNRSVPQFPRKMRPILLLPSQNCLAHRRDPTKVSCCYGYRM